MSSITSSSLNVSVFSVSECLPVEDFFPILSDNLVRFRFKDISETNDEQSLGWVQVEDKTKSSFSSPEFLHVNEYVFLSVRKDIRRVPSAVLDQECAQLEAIWLEDHAGLKRPPKSVMAELKEKAKSSLLTKTLPVPKVFHAIWDTEMQRLFVLSTSNADVDMFVDLFHKTFDSLHLVEQVPFGWAQGATVLNGGLYGKLHEHNQATTVSLLDLINSNKWIGQEFALWLLSSPMAVQGLAVWADEKITLCGDNKKAVFSGSIPENMGAIRAAIAEGKRISDIVVNIETNDGLVFKANLNTETFHLKGVKLPPVKSDYMDRAEDMLQAEYLLRTSLLNDVIGHLFGRCLFEFLSSYLLSPESHKILINDFLES